MKIDGRQIASQIISDLKARVDKLKEKNILPNLYIILLSDDASSASYIKQKMLRGEEIGAKITLDKENPQITTEQLVEKIKKLNNDKNVHGIIVQRPMPDKLDEEKIKESVISTKDVDGFNPNTNFGTPVAIAVWKILENTHKENFEPWIKTQNITVLGKGVTAGGPIIRLLQKRGLNPNIISSTTQNREEILQNSDIVISAVGKKDVVLAKDIKNQAIVIGVGMHMEDDGKFRGDFNEEEIAKIASFYSPTPGGVGPVNVAMLMSNLVTATENSQ